MKITTDTNVLVRLFVEDNRAQSDAVRRMLAKADAVVIPTTALCEMVWVLRGQYGQSRQVALKAIEDLVQTEGVIVDEPVVQAGLNVMRRGGDFADGAIAQDGRARGGTTFMSFDRKAVRVMMQLGLKSRLVASSPSAAD